MEERLTTLYITEKYMVLIAAVRLLVKANIKSIEEAQRILEFQSLKEEPFHYDKLYSNLIQAVLDKRAFEFIDTFLYDVKSASIYYDEIIVAYFHQLRNCQEDMFCMLIKIEEQLIDMAYSTGGDSYEVHTEKAVDYLHKNKILNEIIVYKDESGVINKSMLFLDTTVAILTKGTDRMDRFSFRL